MTITYGSVCSGIEAASMAWEGLGMKPSWFSQFDPEHNYKRGPDFPSAVLAHHWPDVANLGDMAKIAEKVLNGDVAAPDILVGGTPCQAFSVAGARAGLSDPRGQLTLSYVDLANAIDSKRASEGKRPTIIVWENVPGVLNSKDNAFGCFLGALSGEDDQLIPPGKKWSNAGCVFGPQRAIAWIVKDAQYFGVAQRRRRVFVVASADPRINPTEILFESEGVRRDIAPSRGEGAQVAALTANGVGTCGADDNQAQAGHLIAFGGGNTSGSIDVASACTAHGVRMDFDTETFAVHGTQDPDTRRELAHTLGRNNGQENALITIGSAFCIQHAQIGRTDSAGPQGKGYQPDIAYTLDSRPVADVVAFSSKDYGGDATYDLSPTLRASGHRDSHQNGGSPPAIFFDYQVRRLMPVECERLQGFTDGHTDIGADGPRYKAIGNSMAVPVMKWIGERIMTQLQEHSKPEKTVGDYGGSTTPVDIRDLWQTPPQIYRHLDKEFGFSVDLAASNVNKLHDNYITAEMNTLKIEWCGMFGKSWGWLNPPYSSIGPFIEKAIEQQEKGFGTVMLVPSDTSVGWFSLALTSVSEVRFITGGRLSFIRADTGKAVNGNNKGSMLLIFSPHKIGARHFGTVDRDTLMAPL